MSRSLRARGLKHAISKLKSSSSTVALFTGAWIETFAVVKKITDKLVALFTGAWIETEQSVMCLNLFFCRALYGRVD